MPQRTRSKWAAGSRRVAALLAAWTMTPGCAVTQSPGEVLEAPELGVEEAVVATGSSAVAKCVIAPGELESRRGGHGIGDPQRLLRVARAEPPHAGVELHVHPRGTAGRDQLGDEGLVPGDDVGVGRQRDRQLLGRQRAHHEQARIDALRAQVGGLLRGGHGQPGGAAGQRRARAGPRRRGRTRRP